MRGVKHIPPGYSYCPDCKSIKPLSEFYRSKKRIAYPYCKFHSGIRTKIWKTNNRQRYLDVLRKSYKKRRDGGSLKINRQKARTNKTNWEKRTGYRKKHYEKYRDKINLRKREIDKKSRETLSDRYIKTQLKNLGFALITPEIIQAKRTLLKLKRTIKYGNLLINNL